jgi:hypothetical protein
MVATAKIAPTIDIRELVTGTGPFGPSEIRGLTHALGNNASAHRDVRGAVRELEQMTDRDVVFVSHGHFSRSVLTRWVEQPLSEGVRYGFGTASVAVCGFEYGVRQLSSLGLTTYHKPDIGT